MKLGSLKGGRDGRLVVVSRDLAWCADATHICPTLQAALDDWEDAAPRLENLATDLAHEVVPMMRFHERNAASPLPRAFQRIGGSAYSSKAADPVMYRGGSDGFLAPRDPIQIGDEAWGYDFEAEVVVVTGDVAQGATRARALDAIRLIGLANDISLRNLIPDELASGLGFVQSKPASSFSPVFVTPDELCDWWRDGKLHRVIKVDHNAQPFGRANAGEDMTFDFGAMIAHLAKTRPLVAGSILGSGTASNRGPDDSARRPVADGGTGYSCIDELRTVEQISTGSAKTAFLKRGDSVRIWAEDDHGHPIFGAIEQVAG